MADTNIKMVKGTRLRLTKVDECGTPIPGPGSQLVTRGFVSVTFAPSNKDGNTIESVLADGSTCFSEQDDPEFQYFTIEMVLCGVDPSVVDFTTSNPVVFDDDENVIGIDIETGNPVENFAVEVWAKIPVAACVGGVREYAYFVAGFVHGGSLGDVSIQNDAINGTISGAITKDGAAWGVGPYNVTATKLGAPSPLLTPLSARNHLRISRVKLAPPAESDGPAALGVPATGATAGTPATLTPTNSYAPANLAAMTSVTASPNTAWTSGQYVVVGDGSKAHWNATTWVAGPA